MLLDQSVVLAIEQIFIIITRLIEVIAVIVMLWGVVIFLKEFPKVGLRKKLKLVSLQKSQLIRCQLGTYILLALELMIVADIIRSIISRTWESVAMLAGIVAIRTAVSFFLGKEIEATGKEVKG
jgi:uncharacterized membrane protein